MYIYIYIYEPDQSVRDCPTVPSILFADECKLLQQYFRRRFQLTVTALVLYVGAPSRAPVMNEKVEGPARTRKRASRIP